MALVKKKQNDELFDAIQSKDIHAIKEYLQSKSNADYLSLGISSALGAVPIFGPAFQTLVNEVSPRRTEERLFDFVANIAIDFTSFRSDFKKELSQSILSEEFEYIFREVFQRIQFEYQKRKREAFRAILINSISKKVVKGFNLNFMFLQFVDELNEAHIKILDILNNGVPTIGVKQVMTLHLSDGLGAPIGIIKPLVYKLDQLDITDSLSNFLDNTITSNEIKAPERWLTNLGRQFIEFITLPIEEIKK